jgi:hypothetical protein
MVYAGRPHETACEGIQAGINLPAAESRIFRLSGGESKAWSEQCGRSEVGR